MVLVYETESTDKSGNPKVHENYLLVASEYFVIPSTT